MPGRSCTACRRPAREIETHGIGNAFFHLLLDDADFGTNATLAQRLSLQEVENSTLYEGTFYCGRVGKRDREKQFDEARSLVEGVLGEKVLAWRNHDRPIGKVCVVSGGGMLTNDVKEAVDRGCDVYVTGGETLYTVEYAKFTGINLFVGRHTGTELPGVESLAHKVREKLPDIQCVLLPEESIE